MTGIRCPLWLSLFVVALPQLASADVAANDSPVSWTARCEEAFTNAKARLTRLDPVFANAVVERASPSLCIPRQARMTEGHSPMCENPPLDAQGVVLRLGSFEERRGAVYAAVPNGEFLRAAIVSWPREIRGHSWQRLRAASSESLAPSVTWRWEDKAVRGRWFLLELRSTVKSERLFRRVVRAAMDDCTTD